MEDRLEYQRPSGVWVAPRLEQDERTGLWLPHPVQSATHDLRAEDTAAWMRDAVYAYPGWALQQRNPPRDFYPAGYQPLGGLGPYMPGSFESFYERLKRSVARAYFPEPWQVKSLERGTT